MPGRSTNLEIVGQELTVLAVGAGGYCSNIFLLSPIITFFFLPLGRWVVDGWLYAMESRLRLRRSPPQARLESGTAISASHQLTELPGLLFGETGDGSI